MNKKTIAAAFVVGTLLGYLIGVPAPSSQATSPDDACKDKLVELRNVDDRGFFLSSQVISACSDMLTAASTLDFDTVEEKTREVNSVSEEILKAGQERQSVLEKFDIKHEPQE